MDTTRISALALSTSLVLFSSAGFYGCANDASETSSAPSAAANAAASDGRLVTYDINTNTNYNPTVESEASSSGPEAVARYLASLLESAVPAHSVSS